MALVNYVRENIAFMEYAADNSVTANEQLVWHALFHIMNKHANSNLWPDESISISNKRLLSYLPISEDAMIKSRARLVQRGRIRYEAGKKNTANPKYALVLFMPETDYPLTADNLPGNAWGNAAVHQKEDMREQPPTSTGDILRKPSTNKPQIKPASKQNVDFVDYGESADEDEEAIRDARLDALRAQLSLAFVSAFGRKALPAEIEGLLRIVTGEICSPELVARALTTAALNGATNPYQYTTAICHEWKRDFVRTIEELDIYQYYEDAKSGRLGGAHQNDDTRREAIELYQERKRRYYEEKGWEYIEE